MSCQRVMDHALRPGDPVQGCWHLHLEPLPRLVSAARDFVGEHAPPLPGDTRDALLLLTSELVTNAVLHARTPLEVGITVAETAILVTVHDQDLALPQQQPDRAREGGWGLALVSALAEDSAMEPHAEGGKTAWFRLPRGAVEPVADAAAERRQPTGAQDVQGRA